MKLIGMIGGMSWESSALYYRLLNQAAHRRLGGHHNARSVLYTLDFDGINRMAAEGRWDEVGAVLADAARRLESAGADFVLITAVSGHAVAAAVEAAMRVPLLHLADPLGEALRAQGITTVGLLGTRYTMEMDFFTDRLRDRFGLEVLVPPPDQRSALHSIIIEELTLGRVTPQARTTLLAIAGELASRGAGAVAVACTELPILAELDAYAVPAFDVVQLHVEAALERALTESSAAPGG
ncbi:aspartate/glutamate racemase family protein [Mycoplana rhizolycopersici]|uniref:Amino acid racemase n=1 Tax=Mycoplana rhizolycopersici TaxID=2746702 RepID=A0ABX2QI89_9HYPH|nr:amino acid racemase [Rhizobium rhizolycopersici]NVP57504.1 amino acid racemase [Rhizobium rhizolycopersici]